MNKYNICLMDIVFFINKIFDKSYDVIISEVLLVVFIVLKVTHIINWNIWLIMTPILIPIIASFFSMIIFIFLIIIDRYKK